eukprot:maker-scaffold_11-snap-gene-5.10-mRNA-1 protein AED:0.44 eAED:0.44 QI:0/0/0/1/0/0.5/2/0/591
MKNKEDKYDRQIRLWGAEGQKLLSRSHVLLVGASCVGCEALKSLILPGLGSFTIVDDRNVSKADIYSNFFLSYSSLNKPLSHSCCKELQKLNPDSTGHSEHLKNCEEYLEHTDFTSFDLIILTNKFFSEKNLYKLESQDIPVIYVQSWGFLGLIKTSFSSHCVFDKKPNPKPFEDLHLYATFTELYNFQQELYDNEDSSNLPYTVLLSEALKEFYSKYRNKSSTKLNPIEIYPDYLISGEKKMKLEENTVKLISQFQNHVCFKSFDELLNLLPRNRKEKKIFEKILCEKFPESHKPDNFLEAVDYAYICYNPRPQPQLNLPPSIKSSTSIEHKKFYYLVKTLKMFLDSNYGNGLPPLTGNIPDQSTSSLVYSKLSKIYQEKAEADRKIFHLFLDTLLEQDDSDLFITQKESKIFCSANQNIDFLYSKNLVFTLDRFKSLTLEDPFPPFNKALAPEIILILFSVVEKLMVSSDLFLISSEAMFLNTKQLLEQAFNSVQDDMVKDRLSLDDSEIHSLVKEVVRYFEKSTNTFFEINSESTVLGALVGQEAMKFITKQFMPLNNTYVRVGLNGKGSHFHLGKKGTPAFSQSVYK